MAEKNIIKVSANALENLAEDIRRDHFNVESEFLGELSARFGSWTITYAENGELVSVQSKRAIYVA